MTETNAAGQNIRTKTVPVGPGAQNCANAANGTTVCTIGVQADVSAAEPFTIGTFASSDGSGPALATSAISLAVRSDGSTSVPVSLDGVADHVAVTPPSIHPVSNAGIQTFTVSVTAFDASGAVIVGSDSLAGPVAFVTSNDTNGALALTPRALTVANAPVNVVFDGSKKLTDATITATTQAGRSTPLDVSPLNVSVNEFDIAVGGPPLTATVSEAGFTGTYSVSAITRQLAYDAPATGFTTSLSPSGPGSAGVTIQPPANAGAGSAGVTYVAISDGTTVASVPLYLTYAMLTEAFENQSIAADVAGLIDDATGQAWFFALSGTGWLAGPVDPAKGVSNGSSILQPQGGIVLGPDGNFWYGGTVLHPPAGTQPQQLCSFNVAARQQSCSGLGTFVTAGVYNGKIIAAGTFGPATCGNAASIAQIDPGTHKIVTCAPIDPSIAPGAILGNAQGYTGGVVTQDGHVWLPLNGEQQVLRIAIADGSVTQYPIPSNTSLALAPDGKIWLGPFATLDPASGNVTTLLPPWPSSRLIGGAPVAFQPGGSVWFNAASTCCGIDGSYLGSYSSGGGFDIRVTAGPAALRARGLPYGVLKNIVFVGKTLLYVTDGGPLVGFSLIGVTLP